MAFEAINRGSNPCPPVLENMYFVYLIECRDGSLYAGITTDVKRRLEEHKSGKGGRYTRAKGVKKIIHTEEYPNRSSALKREAEIKKWKREKKVALFSKR